MIPNIQWDAVDVQFNIVIITQDIDIFCFRHSNQNVTHMLSYIIEFTPNHSESWMKNLKLCYIIFQLMLVNVPYVIGGRKLNRHEYKSFKIMHVRFI